MPTAAAISTSNSLPAPPINAIVPAKDSVPFSTILKALREKVESLPESVPTADETGPLAGYSCDPRELTRDILADTDIWETWDQRLNVLIPHSIPGIYPLITRGKYGLIGLVQLLEHLICDRNVDEGLLEGKVGRVIEAIDRHAFLVASSHPTLVLTVLFLSSVCKQQDVPKDVVQVGTSHDLAPASQPGLKKAAGKTSKRVRGSWVPPNTISPK
jgi:hypothetical protein